MTKGVKKMLKGIKAIWMINRLFYRMEKIARPIGTEEWDPDKIQHYLDVITRIKRDWPKDSLVSRYMSHDIATLKSVFIGGWYDIK